MTIINQNKTTGNDASDKSSQNGFTFLELKKEFLNQYELPEQSFPVRISALENFVSKGTMEIPFLADECMTYCQQHPEDKKNFRNTLVRLCYLAGIIVGRNGNDRQAQIYFEQAYIEAPSNIQVASNYALALSNNGDFDKSLEVYERILSFLEDGQVGFSVEIWKEAVKLHHMKGNLRRALELVEISIRMDPQNFGESAVKYAEDLRGKIQKEL